LLFVENIITSRAGALQSQPYGRGHLCVTCSCSTHTVTYAILHAYCTCDVSTWHIFIPFAYSTHDIMFNMEIQVPASICDGVEQTFIEIVSTNGKHNLHNSNYTVERTL